MQEFLNNIISKRNGKAAGLLRQPSVTRCSHGGASGAISFVLGLTLERAHHRRKPGGILEKQNRLSRFWTSWSACSVPSFIILLT